LKRDYNKKCHLPVPQENKKRKTLLRTREKLEVQAGKLQQFSFVIFFSHKFPAQHNLISNFSPVHRDA
jgi:hypothetical protein